MDEVGAVTRGIRIPSCKGNRSRNKLFSRRRLREEEQIQGECYVPRYSGRRVTRTDEGPQRPSDRAAKGCRQFIWRPMLQMLRRFDIG